MKFMQLSHEDVLNALPERASDAHKGDFGKLLLLCGSKGYTGAAALSAMGAMRTGAGLVFLGVPESIYEIEAVKLNEPIVFPLPDQDGMLSTESVDIIIDKLKDKNVVLIGPGLGQSKGTESVVLSVMKHFQGPVVLDADGINLICKHKDVLRGRTSKTILTPHKGEFVRLLGRDMGVRVQDAADFATDYGVILLLKGHDTVITDGQTCYINPTGNPGMAVGGSGDVLSGIIVALLGLGIEPLMAAACGAWLHGKSGDICADEIGQHGMLPSDMLNVLPRLLK